MDKERNETPRVVKEMANLVVNDCFIGMDMWNDNKIDILNHPDLIGTRLAAFRYYSWPEYVHDDKKGQPKGIGQRSTTSRNGYTDYRANSSTSPRLHICAKFPVEVPLLRYAFGDPHEGKASETALGPMHFRLFGVKKMTDAMKYEHDTEDLVYPDNSENQNFLKALDYVAKEYDKRLGYGTRAQEAYVLKCKEAMDGAMIAPSWLTLPFPPTEIEIRGFVYWLLDPERWLIKVGFSESPFRRLQQLEINGTCLGFLGAFRGGRSLEKFFHRKLHQSSWHGGEWFRAGPAMEYFRAIHENDLFAKIRMRPGR